MLVAHRGGARLAPENTVVAFREAIERWHADMLEMDVHLTRDGHVVVIHDETVDRTTDGSGRVRDMELTELQALDAGYRFLDLDGRHAFRGQGVRVPTFEEVLTAFPNARLNVEVKDAAAAAPLVEVIDRHGQHARVLVAAFPERCRRGARGYPGPWGASRPQVAWFLVLHRLPGGGPYTPHADIFQIPDTRRGVRIVTPRFIREAHRRNIPVQIWTVDEPRDMRRLLDWGADGIQTDRPDLLATVLHEMFGRPLPPGVDRAPEVA